MDKYPVYENIAEERQIRRGQLPFDVRLHSIGRIPLHYHDFAEVSFVVEGEGTEWCDGHSRAVGEGALSLFLPRQMHKVESVSAERPLRVFCCMFDLSMLVGAADSELYKWMLQEDGQAERFLLLPENERGRFLGIMTDMLDEYRHLRFGRMSLLRTRLVEILVLLARGMKGTAPAVLPVSGRESRLLEDMVHYVHLHFNEPLTLQTMADRFGHSPSYISRYFSRAAGHAFLDYVHHLRTRHAAHLLATTEMSALDIAAEVGFDSYRTFSRVFKRHAGVTPSQYRERR
ncbi:AraC family transcriptional regulator [Paenibacillus sp. CC-CFT747]|nr:AraC family transcriptional regulator [Paenibacillus sp. CC-CFT747]